MAAITSRLVSLAVLYASAAWPQAALVKQWRPPANEPRAEPRMSCSSLRSLTGYEFIVISAEARPASGDLPAYCRVIGQVQPEIRFEVALPSSWAKRLLMIGNGGYAGEDLDAPNRVATREEAIRAGLAFTQTNTGHDAATEPFGTFAVSSQKLLDYSFRAVHVTAETAKRIATAYYGAAPGRSYFLGCSTGGRQALMSAQRFPQDFDGIVVGAPVLDFVNTMLNYVAIQQAFAAAPVSVAKLKLVGDIAYAQCDAKDGVKDGVIDDPRRCGFKPAVDLPKCEAADSADCFTAGQIRTLETIYSDQSIKGQRVFPAWPIGIEATITNGSIGWQGWLVGDSRPPAQVLLAESFFRYFAQPKKDPNLQISQIDLERNLPNLEPIRKTLNATDPDLSAFRDRGGKMLMYYGWADPALNPNMGVEYYESVLKKMGPGVKDFFRLFMMPGVFHCGGGVGCDVAPHLATLIDWVEQRKAPDSMIASRVLAGKTVRARPLCPYPLVAKYKGSGSIDEAANFSCAEPSL